MRYIACLTLVSLVLCGALPLINSGDSSATSNFIQLRYRFPQPVLENLGEYDSIKIPGLRVTNLPEMPRVPFKTTHVLIPQNQAVSRVEISGKPILLCEKVKLEFTHTPLPLSSTRRACSEALPTSQPVLYPSELYSNLGTHRCRGYKILILNLYPIHYAPANHELYWYREVDVKIWLASVKNDNNLVRANPADVERVSCIVENPEVTSSYTAKTQPCAHYDYVIITNHELNSSTANYTFQDLANFRSTQGLSTKVVLIEDILNNSAYWSNVPLFNDTQAIVRRFIREAYLNWHTHYVLLGGDVKVVPPRKLYVDAGYGYSDYIPADLYYACLDGEFNADRDEQWGEPGEADLLAEVYVGRAPVSAEQELSNFVRKTIAYAQTNDSYFGEILLVGEHLGFGEVSEWGGNYKDEIKNGSSAHGYTTVGIPSQYTVKTLYERDVEWSKSDIIERSNHTHIINHLGHGSINFLMKLNKEDVKQLTNTNYFLLYSQGCYAGAFDNRDASGNYVGDAIGEYLVSSTGGAFAFIGNSRYGWGAPYSTDGANQHFDREFYDARFAENISELGRLLEDSKEDCVAWIEEPHIRWCYYGLNLLGDPLVRLKKPSPSMYGVEVWELDVSPYGLVNKTLHPRTIIYNPTEENKNVTVEFIINEELINSTLVQVGKECYRELCFEWLPLATNTYKLEVRASTNNYTHKLARRVIIGADIAVTELSVPEYLLPGKSTNASVRVKNCGLTTATFNVSFVVDEELVCTRNLTLSSQSEGVTNFTHTYFENSTVKAIASLINEPYLQNNELEKDILVFKPKIYRVAVVDSWGTDEYYDAVWDELTTYWYRYGTTKFIINYTSLNREDIDYCALVNTGADALILSDAWDKDGGWEYTPNEIAAIANYTYHAHGLIGTGGTLCSYAPRNMELAELFGLNSTPQGTWAKSYSKEFSLLDPENALFENLPPNYKSACPYTVLNLNVTNATVVASSTYGRAMITEYLPKKGASVYFTHLPEYYTASSQDKQLCYNALKLAISNRKLWVRDLAVINFSSPDWVLPNRSFIVRAEIKNEGKENLSGEIYLKVNGSVINSTQIELKAGKILPVNFNCSLPEGEYIVSVKAIAGEENLTENNHQSKLVRVFVPREEIKVGVVDSWGSDYYASSVLGEITDEWYRYGKHPVCIDNGTLNKENITYQDLVNSSAEVLLISDAWAKSRGWEFTNEEIHAIAQYVQEGHGMIGTAGTLSTKVPGNMKLAPLFGLNSSAIGTWGLSNTYSQEFLVLENFSLLRNLPIPYRSGSLWTAKRLKLNYSDAGKIVAISTDNKAKIYAYKGVHTKQGCSLYFTHLPEYKTANEQDKQLMMNAFLWCKQNLNLIHELAVTELELPSLWEVSTGRISAIVWNLGLSDEFNVTVSLTIDNSPVAHKTINYLNSGASKTVNFTCALALNSATGSQNKISTKAFSLRSLLDGEHLLGVRVSPVEGEKLIINNLVKKSKSYVPDVYVAPLTIELKATQGEILEKKLCIGNNGTGVLTFELRTNASWLSLDPIEGILNPDTQINVSLIINTTGLAGAHNITVYLETNDPDESLIEIQVTVEVNLPPIAEAGISRLVNEYEVVVFNASNSTDDDGTLVNYTWDFGDGFSSGGERVEHIYYQYGTYTVTLTVRDNKGASSVDQCVVVVNAIPRISTPPLLEGYTLENLTFNATVLDPDDDKLTYRWEFGDGNIWNSTTLINTTHSYQDDGVYTAILSVRDGKGAVSRGEVIVIVHNRKPCPLVKAPREAYTCENLTFDGSASYDLDGKVERWLWRFEDTVLYGPLVEYSFIDEGNYSITLIVIDDDDALAEYTFNIRIHNRPPAPAFSYTPKSPHTFDLIEFEDLSYDLDGECVSWYWQFGDGSISTQESPKHRYLSAGNYLLKLTLKDDDNAINQTTYILTIANSPPTARIKATGKGGVGEGIKFFGGLSKDDDGEIVTYIWYFGDGTISYGESVEHVYRDPGTYCVSLIVNDNQGSIGRKEVQVVVEEGKITLPGFEFLFLLGTFLLLIWRKVFYNPRR